MSEKNAEESTSKSKTKRSPYNDAVAEYETAVEKVQAKNDNLDAAITDINAVVKGGEKPLDEKTMESAKQAIDTAKKTKREIGDRPTKISEIRSRTQELSKPLDYQSVTDEQHPADEAGHESERRIRCDASENGSDGYWHQGGDGRQ